MALSVFVVLILVGGAMQKSATALALRKMILIGSCAVALPFMLNGCAAMFVTGATTTASTQVSQDSRSIGTMIDDETIEQKAYKILKTNSLLTKPEDMSVTITSFNGNVLLTGQTINRDYIKWVVKQVEQLENVRKVYNYVTLQKPVPASVISNDTWITSQVKTQLLFGKDINSNRFKVVTENGNVFLMGIVTRDESKRAINEVLGIEGVRKVYHIFDYIEVQTHTVNGPQADDSITVTPVKGNANSYQDPRMQQQGYRNNATGTYGSNGAATNSNNSSYVPPVQSDQNGGAYIIDDGPSSLLAPANEY